jgi:hypothetical protein
MIGQHPVLEYSRGSGLSLDSLSIAGKHGRQDKFVLECVVAFGRLTLVFQAVKQGYLYVAGGTSSATADVFQPCSRSPGYGGSAFVTKFRPGSPLAYSTLLGGSGGTVPPGPETFCAAVVRLRSPIQETGRVLP